ncbi:MAG: hypothetical protein VYD70_02210 [Planctomycetota bacterium]|nr:hypothetical protein [Planctomycetota bacterium]
MRELKPYRTKQGLQKAIDNGGRFYNFFTHKDDRVVTRAELAKAAGVFTAGVNAFLFLEMAQQGLESKDQQSIIDLLDSGLRKAYRRNKPKILAPSEVERGGTAGTSVIVTGYPKFVEDRTQFNGFIMIPIMSGKVMTFMMIPIFDQFDVYEVFDDRRMRKPNSMVATVRGQRFTHEGPIRFGGVLRKLTFEDSTQKSHKFYLDTLFYTKL